MADISFKGGQELLSALEKMAHTDVYKEVIRENGSSLQKMAQREAVLTKGYSAGVTKRSIKLKLGTSGLEVRVKVATNHSSYLEVGTRKMEAQPFVQPAFNEIRPKPIKDLRRAGIVK